MQVIKRILFILVVLVIGYLAGPNPGEPVYNTSLPVIPSVREIEQYVASNELKHRLRTDNEARIIWANDSTRQVTPYAVVYLHGFSASQEEGDPVHRNIAKSFGCNLYLSRLSQHGIDTVDQLVNLDPDNYWESAKEALAIGKRLGQKVILMGTSTGASQALQLAATFPSDIAALILYSPNIAINDPNAWILNNQWGLQIARIVKGSRYNTPQDTRPIYKQYWNSPYRLEAAVSLQEMLETTMTSETFKKVYQPVLMLYYYKDDKNQDRVVRVSAMKEMYAALSTPANLKKEMALPATGDHVIASPIKSKDVGSVERETRNFLIHTLKIPQVYQ